METAPLNQHGTFGGPTHNGRQRELSLLHLTVMLFCLTCGGPFGIEMSVKAAGPLLTMIGILVVPFVYCLPQSFMVAELSSMMPSNHGSIKWVHEGLGTFAGFVYAGNDLFSTMVDLPTYIVLFSEYLASVTNGYLSWWQLWLIRFGLVMACAIMNSFRVKILGHTTLIIAIAIMAPFIIGFFFAIPYINVTTWIDTTPRNSTGQIDWILFVSTVLWLHTGWDCVSHLAGEVSFDLRTYVRAFLWANALDLFCYMLPLIVCFAIADIDQFSSSVSDAWSDNYLVDVYSYIWWPLGIAVVAAAFISNISLYLVELSTCVREIWAVSQPDSYQMLPTLFGSESQQTQSPINAIVLISAVNSVLISFSFAFLLKFSIAVSMASFLLEFSAFLVLRYTQANVPRPYTMPGGLVAAWALTIFKGVLLIGYLAVVAYQEWFIFVLTIAFNIVLVFGYALRQHCIPHMFGRRYADRYNAKSISSLHKSMIQPYRYYNIDLKFFEDNLAALSESYSDQFMEASDYVTPAGVEIQPLIGGNVDIAAVAVADIAIVGKGGNEEETIDGGIDDNSVQSMTASQQSESSLYQFTGYE